MREPDDRDSAREQTARFILGLRAAGVRDTRVLAALERVPRRLFVDPALGAEAHEHRALPIDCGQTVSPPRLVAAMTEQLGLDERMKVLEIGTGSGYHAAVLAHLARRVYSIERYRTLARAAEARFAALKLSNITVVVGDGLEGWPPQAPFDRILVTGAVERVPEALLHQLREGGVMLLPVGKPGAPQYLRRIRRTACGVEDTELMEVSVAPLVPGRARRL